MQTTEDITTPLIERKAIEGTPFTIIKQTTDNDKTVYFLVMGDHRLTEPETSEENLMLMLEVQHWKIITTVIAIIVEKTLEIKEAKISNTINLYREGSIPENEAIQNLTHSKLKPNGKNTRRRQTRSRQKNEGSPSQL